MRIAYKISFILFAVAALFVVAALAFRLSFDRFCFVPIGLTVLGVFIAVGSDIFKKH